ncbi:hypothetical protein CHS0354_011017 [Potamilus streckersoni]|uniref:Uncharacterized protein n=1 Tax=Potamilus streckersoni TaxID=2493646 RepID=A0AAE0WEH2_9BIVA|nr:hypothetical protein CHS0354_011017 [Potamilus streckersoni]
MREFNENSGSMFEVKNDRQRKFETNSSRDNSEGAKNISSSVERIHIHQNGSPRVRWVDENLKLPLALEVNEGFRTRSDSLNKPDELKPILKHKATCIVVVSNS